MAKSNAAMVFEWRGEPGGLFAGKAWRFRRGQQWAVMGPNGSGKSYLAALLAGEAPLRGVQLQFGEGVEDRVALASFAQQQEQAAHGWLQARWHWMDDDEALSVRAFLSYERVNDINPFEVLGGEAGERRAFARGLREASEIFRLKPLFGRCLAQLSNGEMRRVLLARALLKAPALLVLDDPFAGLDPEMRVRLQGALDRLAEQGLPLVLMLRHVDEIPSCVTHLLTLKDGRIEGQRRLLRRSSGRSAHGSVRPPHAGAADRGRHGGRASARVVGTGERVIELHNVTVRYGRRVVLNKLDWTVRAGERWLVAGPNGSGKTTLLSLITGDNPAAYANDVRVFGRAREPGESLWAIRCRIGQVSPEIQCFFDSGMSCLEAVLSGRFNREGNPMRATREAREAARDWLRTLGLEGTEKTAFGALSAGNQRLVLLARAMLPQPDLLLLDEPCLNLDVASRRLVLGVLERLLRVRRDEAVICVAHRPDDVPRGFNQVLRLGPA